MCGKILMHKTLIAFLAFSACALGSPLAYVTTITGEFGTMNIGTGAFTEIAAEPSGLSGLAWGSNGSLYGLSAAGNLVTIDPVTGAETVVGNTGLGADTNTFAGLTDGALYALDNSNNLYSINPTTGTADTGGRHRRPADQSGRLQLWLVLRLIDGRRQHALCLGTNFGASTLSEMFYTVNPTTAATTTVGGLPEDSFVGSGYLGGSYYLFSADANAPIFTVNPSTGATSFVTNSQVAIYGAVNAVPEPRTLGLVLAGLLMVSVLGYKRKQRKAEADGPNVV